MRHLFGLFIFLASLYSFQGWASKESCERILADDAQILMRWREANIYRYDPSFPRERTFVVDGGPPTLSGSLHVGHVATYVPVDILARFQRMQGKTVFYPMGWDTNGQPTMMKIQRDLGLEINAANRASAPEFCQTLVCKTEPALWEVFDRIGLGLDPALRYQTFDHNHRLESQRLFLEMLRAGQVKAKAPAEADSAEIYPDKEDGGLTQFRDPDGHSAALWYVPVNQIREALTEAAKTINFMGNLSALRPALAEARHWMISRSRHYGIPIPVWYPVSAEGVINYHAPILPAAEQLPVDPYRATPPGFDESKRNQPGGFVGETNVLDTWFTSTLTYLIQAKMHGQKLLPADIRSHGIDVTAQWGLRSLVQAHYHLAGQPPFLNVIIHGNVTDKNGRKMSKSEGNTVDPIELLNSYGGDAVRGWAAEVSKTAPRISESSLTAAFRKSRELRVRTARLVEMLRENPDWINFRPGSSPIEAAYLARLEETIQAVTAHLTRHQYRDAYVALMDDYNVFSNGAFLAMSRRISATSGAERAESVASLYALMTTYLKLFAPFFPFATDFAWNQIREIVPPNLDLPASIHNSHWPTTVNGAHKGGSEDDFAVINQFLYTLGSETKLGPILTMKIYSSTQGLQVTEPFKKFDVQGYWKIPSVEFEPEAPKSSVQITQAGAALKTIPLKSP